MITCITVDDEPIARRGMKRLIERNPQLNLLASFGTADSVMEFLSDNDVDLIFLDIQMPGMTGMELARKLPAHTMVIFTTAYSEYAVESYETDAIGYLMKPINPELFDKAVKKAIDYHDLLSKAPDDAGTTACSTDHIIIKADRRFHRLNYQDIVYVEGLKDYVILHIADGRRLVTHSTLKAMAEMLPQGLFLRVNKSNIVNVAVVDSFDSNDIFIGDAEISIGLNFRDEVMGRLMK